MKEEKETQFRKDSELELSKERKEVRDGRIGLSKDAENKRRLSKAEEKRRTVFEMKKKEFLSQGLARRPRPCRPAVQRAPCST